MVKKGYNVFIKMYVTGRRGRGRPQKVYIFLISINSRVDWAMSVCLSGRPSDRMFERVDLRNQKNWRLRTWYV